MSKIEYWKIELKNQNKQKLSTLEENLKKFDGKIIARHESKYFSGKQKWRNPLILKISLPHGKRFSFIKASRIWLHRPTKILINSPNTREIQVPLRGNHEEMLRSYQYKRSTRIDPRQSAYIKSYSSDGSFKVIKGAETVKRFLDGDLDIVVE